MQMVNVWTECKRMVYGKESLEWSFFFQAEDGIRDLVRSRGLGDVYKRQDELGFSYSCP